GRHGHGPQHLPLDCRTAPRPPDLQASPRRRRNLHSHPSRRTGTRIRMNTACAHIVDDDEAIRDALQCLLKTRKIPCATWPSAEAFLAALTPGWHGCVVLDIRMDGMSGLECFDALRARGNE